MKIQAWTEKLHAGRIDNTCIRYRTLLCRRLTEQDITGETV
jgi:hypothetical protein